MYLNQVMTATQQSQIGYFQDPYPLHKSQTLYTPSSIMYYFIYTIVKLKESEKSSYRKQGTEQER